MRFRPAIALFLAYALTLAPVLGGLSSASLAGTNHIELCITSAKDGKPLPAHPGDHGSCCFAATGQSAGLAPSTAEVSGPAFFNGEKIVVLAFRKVASTEIASGHPRAPPAKS